MIPYLYNTMNFMLIIGCTGVDCTLHAMRGPKEEKSRIFIHRLRDLYVKDSTLGRQQCLGDFITI